MLVTCWSVKGGSGTTVVAATLALLAARTPAGALLADLGGDLPAVLGLPEPSGPGLADWLAAAPDVGGAALHRIEIEAVPGLALLPHGGPPPPRRGADLAVALSADDRTVVVDAGLAQGAAHDVVAASTVSLLVLRPCYLALRRAATAALRPSGVVLVTEPYRALRRSDVEAVLGVPVRAEVLVEPAVARAVDAGLLASRLPRSLANGLRRAA
jgi:hypothetical protein